MIKIVFAAKVGWWGERYMVSIRCWQWFKLAVTGIYITKVRIIRRKFWRNAPARTVS